MLQSGLSVLIQEDEMFARTKDSERQDRESVDAGFEANWPHFSLDFAVTSLMNRHEPSDMILFFEE
jgi:hypothetical protein